VHAGINLKTKPGIQFLATSLPHHPVQQVRSDQLYPNKYEKLFTKIFAGSIHTRTQTHPEHQLVRALAVNTPFIRRTICGEW
jgi:hypothetical protein